MKTLTMDKQPTQADLFKVELDCTRTEVMDVTGLSEDELEQIMFEQAFAWLQAQGCDPAMQLNFASNKEFWGFWKRSWYQADREFLRHFYYWGYDPMQCVHFYEWFHNSDSYPMNDAMINSAYHSLIKTLAVKR